MANEAWEKIAIGELIEQGVILVQKDGNHGSNYPRANEFGDEGVPFLTAKLLNDSGTIDLLSAPRLNYGKASKMKFGYIQEGDVLLSHNATVGRVAVVPSLKEDVLIGTSLTHYRLDSTRLLPKYLAAYFRGRDFQNQLSAFMGGMSTRNQVPITAQRRLEVVVPPMKEQKHISEILESFDKKIDLNRQANQILEQMAQALFKSWFVDFDPVFDNALANGVAVSDFPEALQKKAQQRFEQHQQLESTESDVKALPADILKLFPNEFEQTDEPSIGINGWIPEGWVKSSFESLIKLIGGGTPKTSIEEYWNGDIPWFSVVDAPNDSDVFVLDTEKHVTQLGVDKSSTKILRVGTTIISARGTVGKCALVAEPMAMNQSCYGINAIEGVSDAFIYFMTRHQVSDLQKRGHGSVFNTVTRETFKSILLPFSGGEVTQKFSEAVSPFLNKILLNNKQNEELMKTRDVLLPKLISGELQLQE